MAVLPQSPSYRIDPTTGVLGSALTQARNRLFVRWQQRTPPIAAKWRYSSYRSACVNPKNALYRATFIEQIRRQNQQLANTQSQVDTTLDANLQQLVEKQVEAFIRRNNSRGIHNAAVLLLDTRDMGVRALVGSANYYDREIQGQVNGTNAKRSPGSTLKPFIML